MDIEKYLKKEKIEKSVSNLKANDRVKQKILDESKDTDYVHKECDTRRDHIGQSWTNCENTEDDQNTKCAMRIVNTHIGITKYHDG